LSISVQQKMQSSFNSGVNCGATDESCLNALSLDTIIDVQTDLFNNAFYDIDPSVGQGEPIRVVHDGVFITSPLDSTAPFPHVSKPLLISTVRDEAAFAIYGAITNPLPSNMLDPVVNATFGSPRTDQIVSSSRYVVPAPPKGSTKDTVDARAQLEELGTDYLWRCSSWTFARNWVQNGGSAYVGMYVVGATYPGNEAVPYCTQPGVVCHQDDIEIVVCSFSSILLYPGFI
jgi:carboxylesterase type B